MKKRIYVILVFMVLVTAAIGGFNVYTSRVNDRMNLVIACGNGNLGIVKEYIPIVQNLNFISLKGETPLTAAAYNGHLPIMKLLIENGADINFKDSGGDTPLQVAREKGRQEVVAYLNSVANEKT